MIAHFNYHIPRHHGKYGLAVSVYKSAEERKADYRDCSFERRLDYIKTYKYNNEDGVDLGKQIEELINRVMKKYPNCVFDN